jgi:hypothetical protein
MPTQAFSEFLTNKRLGDWGEDVVRRSIPSEYIVVKYGRSGDRVAGEPGFREFYQRYQNELDEFGKRPDLLVFKREDYSHSRTDLGEVDNEELEEVVSKAIAGIEVRSSNYLSRNYRAGQASPFDVLSFTVKVEDIAIVLKWIENTGVPHYYVQVPFDEVYAIGFHTALEIASDRGNAKVKYVITKDSKSQFKTTLKIPFTEGTKLGDITESPSIVARRRELPGGRLLFYVEFSGGVLTPVQGKWSELFSEAERLKQTPPSA